MKAFLFASFVLVTFVIQCSAFNQAAFKIDSRIAPQKLHSKRPGNDLEDEISSNAYRKAQGGTGELAAGVILGGLVAGPFGALFGAQLGAQMGAKNAVNRARQEEMERLGISQDVLDAARDIGLALNQSNEGMTACQNSLETQQQFARRLDTKMTSLYDAAKEKLTAGEEEAARELLLERTQTEEKLKSVLQSCADEKRRLAQMENNVESLEERAMEMETLLRRTIGAKTTMDSSSMLSLDTEDPLLQKFRDAGID
mmetsp:Transcript_26867/g.39755  ORF Transcript_26867/g.39755 Transcript_26867/m.39755 type:complete len:256 (+) Transcript_26867:58-825(+)